MRVLTLLLCVVMLCPAAQIDLAREQDGLYEPGDYFIAEEVRIPAGKSLTFAAGSIIRFARYATLVVEGHLHCPGTPENPVRFTSQYHRPNTARQPRPFDWNGIIIKDGAITLENVSVDYATIGLQATTPADSIRIVNSVFRGIGNDAFTLNNKIIDVPDGALFSFPTVASGGEPDADTVAPVNDKPVSQAITPLKKGLRFAGAGLCIAGLAAVVAGQYLAVEAQKEYEDAGRDTVDDVREERDRMRMVRNIGIGCAAAGAVGCTLTFVF